MTKTQLDKIKEIAGMVDEFGIDDLIEKLRYEALKAAYVYQYLDNNPGSKRNIGKIYEDFEKIMLDQKAKDKAELSLVKVQKSSE